MVFIPKYHSNRFEPLGRSTTNNSTVNLDLFMYCVICFDKRRIHMYSTHTRGCLAAHLHLLIVCTQHYTCTDAYTTHIYTYTLHQPPFPTWTTHSTRLNDKWSKNEVSTQKTLNQSRKHLFIIILFFLLFRDFDRFLSFSNHFETIERATIEFPILLNRSK